MATISFKLASAKTELKPLFARYSHKPTAAAANTEFMVSTGISLLPSQLKNGEVVKHEESVHLNQQINKVKERLQTAVRDCEKASKELIAANVKQYYQIIMRSIEHVKEIGGPKAVDEFINDLELADLDALYEMKNEYLNQIKLLDEKIEFQLRKRNDWKDDLLINYIDKYKTRKGKSTIETSTQRTYDAIAKNFNSFKPNCKLIEIDDKLLYDYQDWLISRKYFNGTIEGYITKIKGVLNYYAAEVPVNKLYARYAFDLPSKQDDVIALEETEVQALKALDFPRKKNGDFTGLERARDLLLLMASTGLRYSDSFLTADDFRDGMIFKILRKTKKFNISVNIPLNPISTYVLEKYNYTIPKIEDDYFNKLIKEVCERIPSLHVKETTINYCGLKEVKERDYKYNMISSHSGRKTFVNILVDYNVPLPNIIALTGHTNIQQLQAYADKRRNLKKRMVNVFQLEANQNHLLITKTMNELTA